MHETDKDSLPYVSPEEIAEMRDKIAQLEVWRQGITLSARLDGQYWRLFGTLSNDVDALAGKTEDEPSVPAPKPARRAQQRPVSAQDIARLETWAIGITHASEVAAEAYSSFLTALHETAGVKRETAVVLGSIVIEPELEVGTNRGMNAESEDNNEPELSTAEIEAKTKEVLEKYGLTEEELYHAGVYIFLRQPKKPDKAHARSLEEEFRHRGIYPLGEKQVEALEDYRQKPTRNDKSMSSADRREQTMKNRLDSAMKVVQLVETPQEFTNFLRELPHLQDTPLAGFINFLRQFSDELRRDQLSEILNDLSKHNRSNTKFYNKTRRQNKNK